MTLHPWQRANILAAASYLRDLSAAGAGTPRTEAIHQGLLEVLDPARRVVRLQRELAGAAQAAGRTGQDRRGAKDRRQNDRRKANLGPPNGERRTGKDRRTGRERRAAGRA
jgi:hypothetical protein